MLGPAADVMNSPIPWLAWTGLHMSPWKLIGLTGDAAAIRKDQEHDPSLLRRLRGRPGGR